MDTNEITAAEILVPGASGYEHWPVVMLLGNAHSKLAAYANFGATPVHFITQRGPYQDGETPLDYRYDRRISQLTIMEKFPDRQRFVQTKRSLIKALRPNRSFRGVAGEVAATPAIFRRWYYGGFWVRGSDGEIEAGDTDLYTTTGRFIDYGGLRSGDLIVIDGNNYTITEVTNDYSMKITPGYLGATTTSANWSYIRGSHYRDLFFLQDQGPQFSNSAKNSQPVRAGYRETVRMISHDPFWYGAEQSETWSIEEALADLSFDGESAWFPEAAQLPDGRWLFAVDSVNLTIGVVYDGDSRARPTIVVTGPAKDITITNLTTDVFIAVDIDLLSGETLTIDVKEQTAERFDGVTTTDETVNITGDLALFAIEPDPVAADGINNINITFEDAEQAESEALMYWNNAYDSD